MNEGLALYFVKNAVLKTCNGNATLISQLVEFNT